MMKVFFKTIRIHQWTKNVLVFLPLLLSHQFMDTRLILMATYAFLAISMMASSNYIVNDFLDLESDRNHPAKKHRPIASGKVSTNTALMWAGLLFFSSITLAWFVSFTLLELILVYLLVTLSYSYYLKKIVILDVLVLAFLYTLRVLIGAWTLGIPVSEWLFAFSVFLFCSLGFLKRNNEMINNKSQDTNIRISGRGYLVQDISFVQLFGVATGIASVLIFVLYINSDQVRLLYKINYWLWLVAPLLLYWVARMWLIAGRGEMTEDPVVFSIQDKSGYIIFLLIAACMYFAKIGFMPL